MGEERRDGEKEEVKVEG